VEWVETTGRTVAEALEAALDQLHVAEEEMEYEVLEEPQKGLFGRLRVEARVRARVRPVRPRPKAERRDRRRRGGGERGRGRGGAAATATRQRGGRASDTERPNGGAGAGRGGGRGGRAASGATPASGAGAASEAAAAADGTQGGRNGERSGTAAETDQRADEAAQGATRKRRRRRRGRGGGAKEQGAAVVNDTSQATIDGAGSTADLEGQRAAVESFLHGLVEAFGRPEATVDVRTVEDGIIEADVRGDELGLLVGPKGQTLQAVHELVRSMVQRRFVGQSHARVRVDVAGYRQRRKQALERFTRSVVDDVLATGRAKLLDPMAASDRKVVHDVVNEIDGVVTVSQGEEPARRVIIRPG
jgi:spoIIIJ-associated protein